MPFFLEWIFFFGPFYLSVRLDGLQCGGKRGDQQAMSQVGIFWLPGHPVIKVGSKPNATGKDYPCDPSELIADKFLHPNLCFQRYNSNWETPKVM